MGRGGWVRHEGRVVRSLLNADGGQRMANRVFKDRSIHCGMLSHLTYVECVTFPLDPPPSIGLALSSGVCVCVESEAEFLIRLPSEKVATRTGIQG